ncbi:MAG TPA: glycosyltransferase [Candidatus Saccharimonadales bacterium]|nr:glycosyltransferase [Candidatus Saccharimonadales bacterium]
MSKLSSAIAMSIVLNVHAEGARMHSTVKSLVRAMRFAVENNVTIELVVVEDKSDGATERYIERTLMLLAGDIPVTIEKVAYGDLGESRNHGIGAAKGKYVGVVDADDVYVENLIYSAYRLLEKHEGKAVVHPGYVVSFDHHTELWKPVGSDSNEFDVSSMVEFNPWPSLSFAARELRLKVPYKATHVGKGFGPEDWQWNCDTLALGIQHYVMDDSGYFYRRKATGSLAAAHGQHKALLWKNDTLDHYQHPRVPSSSNYDSEQKKPLKNAILSVGRRSSHGVSKMTGKILPKKERTREFNEKMVSAFEALFAPVGTAEVVHEKKTGLPQWLIDEWRKLHDFDHKLFPDTNSVNSIAEYHPIATNVTREYWKLFSALGDDLDYVFIVPWLNKGGADLVVINYVKAVLEINKKARIAVLTTEVKESTWADRLPKGVTFVSLDNNFYDLGFEQQTFVLGTLFIQKAPKRIHLINSAIGYRLFTEYAQSLSKNSHLFISAFSVDRLMSGKREHYLLDHLEYSAPYLTRVFSDNAKITHDLVEWQAFDPSLFSVHYQPSTPIDIPVEKRRPFHPLRSDALKVLWAGRIDRPKRPDILLKIAEKAKERRLNVEFHIYGSPVLDDEEMFNKLKASDNVIYEGPFDNGLWEVPLDRFDLFLMNSEWEGMPNALLQAVVGGVAVMSSSAGGVSEIINQDTGYLIDQYDDVDAYVDRLAYIIDNRDDLKKKRVAAMDVVRKRHTWAAFVDTLRNEKGYTD